MALQIKDRVQETSTTTGTGTLNLAGAVDSFQTFVAGVGDGNTTYYAITDGNGTAWEVGIGTVTDASPDTLSRTTVLASSTGSKISLSSGTHKVFVTYPADKAVFKDANGFVGIGTDSPTYELDVVGDVGVDEYIYHNGDTNTYIRLRGDQFDFVAGGRTMLTLDEAGSDIVTVNDGANDVDFQVKGDSDTNLIRTDAANDLVGIGTASPSYKLDVFGHDAWVQSSGVRIGASGLYLSGTKITATAAELNYIDGVTSAVQTQLDAKQASLTFGISNTNAVKVDSASAADDEYARFTANGLESRSTSEVLSDIGAQASIGGAASTVTSSDLTASRALVSNSSGKIAVSSTTSTELGYLDISTLGTAEASKALTLDSGKKFTGVKDGTFNQYDSWVYASGVKIGASGISMDGSVIKTVQTSAESFADNNSSLMTSAAIADKIEAYSYITATLTEEQVDDFVGGMVAGNTETGISVTYEDSDGTLDFVVSDTTVAGDSGSTGITPGDTLTIAGGTNATSAMVGDTLTVNVADAFLKNDDDDTTTGIITAKGLVANQYGSFVKASGIIIGASGISMGAGRPVVKTIQNSNMSFTDDNTSIMTSAAVADKIESYSYITATLTQEQVEDYVGGMVAGNTETGITVAYQDADGTIDFAVADTTVAGDSGSTGMTPGDTLTIAGGTNATSAMSGDTLTVNVDDAFLVNNADDTTTGIITAKGLVVNHFDSWVHASGTHVGASGVRFSDGTVQKTASAGGGTVSGDTFATDLKIGRDAHNLIDFTTDDAVTFRVGNADEITLAANEFSPTTSDGIALGTGSKMWSDLFIADGGAVNFNNGDATLTHESNKIVASGCELFVNRPGRSLATFRRTNNGDASIVVDASFYDADNDAQLRMLAGTSGECSVFFGDTDDANVGLITYDHDTNALTVKTNDTAAIVIDSNGTLQTKGVIREVATKVHTNYTVTASDHIILVDTDSTDRTITLPTAAAANIGQEYIIKKIDDGTGLVNIVPASTGGAGPDDIDEYDTAYVLFLQHDTVTFVCGPGDASSTDEQWWVVAERVQPHSAQLEQRTAQTVPQRSTNNTVVTMTHVRYEEGCDADTSTNRIDIKRKGKYAITAHCLLDDQHAHWGMKTRVLWYDDSAGTSSYHGETKAVSYIDDARDIGSTTTVLLELDVGDYVQAIIWNSYVGTRNTRVSGVEDYSYIAVQEIK